MNKHLFLHANILKASKKDVAVHSDDHTMALTTTRLPRIPPGTSANARNMQAVSL